MSLLKRDIYCDICNSIMVITEVNKSEWHNGGYSEWYGKWALDSDSREKGYKILTCSNDDCNFAKSLKPIEEMDNGTS